MKFCEKLQKLRKEKGYSQEELADLLDVSRQSVSKWESGTTYPEMDKLLSLCKIFNVTLDDLTNDEVSGDTIKEKSRNNFSNLVYALLDMINKSIEMFKNMTRRDMAKCLSELLLLFIILLICHLPFSYLNNGVLKIFMNFSSKAYSLMASIWMFISNTIYLVLFIAIFIYVYKTRFLDKFNYEDKREEKESIIKEENKNKEINVIKEKAPRERHSFVIFDILGSIFNVCLKIFLFFITIPIVIIFVLLVVFTVITLIVQFMKINYIGIFILFLGGTIACFTIMEVFIRFLFSSNIPFKRLFLTFTTGLVLVSIGAGILTIEVANTKYIAGIPSGIEMNSSETILKMKDNLKVAPYYEVTFIEDESLKEDIKITINYYDDFYSIDTHVFNNYISISDYSTFENAKNMLLLVKDNLEDKVFYEYNLLQEKEIVISSSSKNIEKLKENAKKAEEEMQNENRKYQYYEDKINELEMNNSDKDDRIIELEERITELEQKLDDIRNATR